MSQCVICTRDTTDGCACRSCAGQLVSDLVMLAWLAGELKVTLTRQARLAGGSGLRSTSGSPLGYHVGAAAALDALRNTASTWVRDIHDGREQWPVDTPAAMLLWLAHRGPRLRIHLAVDQLAQDVDRHTKSAFELINPLPDEQTYGICAEELDDGSTCMAHLYGEPKADWVRCKACKTQHPTRERIRTMERRMEAMYFPAATLARILPRFTERAVSASNIRSWAREGRYMIRVLSGEDGYPTYRLGDVIAVAARVAKRDRPKMSKEAS